MGSAKSRLIAPDERALLQIDWIESIIARQISITGRQGGSPIGVGAWTRSLTLSDGERVEFRGTGRRFTVSCPSFETGTLLPVVEEANRLAKRWDTGDGVWWSFSFVSQPSGVDFFSTRFMRKLSEQHLWEGDARLDGFDTLVRFSVEPVDPEHGEISVMTPQRQKCDVTLRTPGPTNGEFSAGLRDWLAPFIRSVCTFSTGLPPSRDAPIFAFEAEEEDKTEAADKLGRAETPSLAAKRPADGTFVGLGAPLAALAVREQPEAFHRARRALLAYESAIDQLSSEVSVILLVSCIEALATPNQSWAQAKLVDRFATFLLELCPEAVATVMNHGNFKEAFGAKTSPRSFLSSVYGERSQMHSGLERGAPLGLSLADPHGTQVALLSEIAREAILAFLLSPRSSLVGSPNS